MFVRGPAITNEIDAWTVKEYPYQLIGATRRFEVRVYHRKAKNFLPYLIVLIDQNTGWIMGADAAATEQAARENAAEMLKYIGRGLH